MDKNKFYIKTRRAADTGKAPQYCFHIHVDSQELLPATTTKTLLDQGLTHDLFDHEWHFFGKDGDPTKPFENHAPAQHMTFATSNAAKFSEMWPRVVKIVEQCPAKCYIEGELIVVDQPLLAKAFDLGAFERLAPILESKKATSFFYHSAIDEKIRSLPAVISLRRLDPAKNGARDRFRSGEAHITVRDDTDPRLLELLCNLGMSVPAIPKLVESEDGALARYHDGSLVTIHDIILTLQAVDMVALMRVANLVVTLIETIGGVKDGSIKIEFATHFAILNGVDYNKSVPPVLDTVQFRPDFEYLDPNHLGSTAINLAELTRQAHKRARTAKHEDKTKQFRDIWERSTR